jgi:N6-L-threonylcarbamoyladenine synthase
MIVLAIDTSCDETCIAVLKFKKNKIEVKSNAVSSQIKIHKKYGGVVPGLARREHQKNLIRILEKSLKEAKLLNKKKSAKVEEKKLKRIKEILKREKSLGYEVEKFFNKYKIPKIDLIGVTKGPGLEPCLWTGISFAKVLSFFWQKSIIPINHLEGHVLANLLKNKKIKFPAVALIASGGHTELLLVKNIKKYKLLGETRDDAAGECLDKIAKIINLPYPGGPEIEKLAKKSKKDAYNLPRPMIWSKDYDFSFSGLKTAVLYLTIKLGEKKVKERKTKEGIATSSQQAIIETLVSKTIKAAKEKKAKTIILGGGVIANKELQKQFNSQIKNKNLKLDLLLPPKNLCTDNAAMVAITAYINREKNIPPKKTAKIKANANLNF